MSNLDLSVAMVVKKVLDYPDRPVKASTLRYLNRLIHVYIRRVPRENISGIAKRHQTPETRECLHWPAEFWNDATRFGVGENGFESSLVFYRLLVALDYRYYLTVNDMGASRGCHAASSL